MSVWENGDIITAARLNNLVCYKTNDNTMWKFIEYGDGRLECYNDISVSTATTYNCSIAHGTVYYTTASFTVPMNNIHNSRKFISIENIQSSFIRTSGSGLPFTNLYNYTLNSDGSISCQAFVCNYASQNVTGKIQLYIRGRWK